MNFTAAEVGPLPDSAQEVSNTTIIHAFRYASLFGYYINVSSNTAFKRNADGKLLLIEMPPGINTRCGQFESHRDAQPQTLPLTGRPRLGLVW